MDTPELTIVRVDLCADSVKARRVLNGGNEDLFPVIVWFSRHIDEYERRELADFGITREEAMACARSSRTRRWS